MKCRLFKAVQDTLPDVKKEPEIVVTTKFVKQAKRRDRKLDHVKASHPFVARKPQPTSTLRTLREGEEFAQEDVINIKMGV